MGFIGGEFMLKKEQSWRILPEYSGIGGGPGSSVGIATDYGLEGPGSNPGGDKIFRPSRPPLGPTQGYRVSPGGKVAGAWR